MVDTAESAMRRELVKGHLHGQKCRLAHLSQNLNDVFLQLRRKMEPEDFVQQVRFVKAVGCHTLVRIGRLGITAAPIYACSGRQYTPKLNPLPETRE